MQKKHSNQNTEKNVASPLQVSSKKPSLIDIKNSIKRNKLPILSIFNLFNKPNEISKIKHRKNKIQYLYHLLKN